MVEAAQVEPDEAEEEPKRLASPPSPPTATELQAELAQLGMDMRGTKFKEALSIFQGWQV